MPGLVRGMARTAAVVGTAQATRGRVAHRQQARWAQEDQAQYQSQPQPAPPQPAPAPAPPPTASAPAADPIEQLEKLGALKAQGILTDEEFEAQKQRILSA
jgi:hypothetical protein